MDIKKLEELISYIIGKIDEINVDMVINQSIISVDDKVNFMLKMRENLEKEDMDAAYKLANSKKGRLIRERDERTYIIKGKFIAYMDICNFLGFTIPQEIRDSLL
jgi:hypothetical protein